jgi:flagellar motor switch protein FliG
MRSDMTDEELVSICVDATTQKEEYDELLSRLAEGKKAVEAIKELNKLEEQINDFIDSEYISQVCKILLKYNKQAMKEER